MHRNEGFTLIEVIIVGALIGVLVAIGVPQLLRARLAANEAGGIAALRAISSSEANYATTCGFGGYATDLADLVKPAPSSGHGFLSPDLSINGVRKSGYILSVAKNADAATTDVLLPTCNAAASPRATLVLCGRGADLAGRDRHPVLRHRHARHDLLSYHRGHPQSDSGRSGIPSVNLRT